MISNEKTSLTFILPKELKEQLEQAAKKEDRSMANLLIRLIKNYLASQNNSN